MTLLLKIGFLDFTWIDALDIMLVSYLLYRIYKLLRGSVAVNIFIGVIAFYSFYLIVRALEMSLLTKILGNFVGVGFLAAFILFQQEIRHFLIMVGRSADWSKESFSKFLLKENITSEIVNINPVVKAAQELSSTQTGALVVFSKSPELKNYIDSGDTIDAEISKRLLVAIFNKYSPMHDGAVIIVGNKIKAARCILPVSPNEELPAQYGLRHRAALGLSEATDSIILIVSEETGEMSLAHEGKIEGNLSSSQIRAKLNSYLYPDNSQPNELKDV